MIRLKHNFTSRLILVVGILLLFAACESRPKGVVSENKMVDVLTDLHKLDGSMNANGILYNAADKKDDYYISVLKKYDMTQAEFDSSLVWYSKNSKNFDHIYDKVILRLTDLQTDIKKGKYHAVDTMELAKVKYIIWNKQTKYILTKDSARTRLNFEIPDQNFMLGDTYILKFLQRIAPEDSCDEQLIRFQINYVDGRVHGVIKMVYNDNLKRRYTLRISSKHAYKIKSISGELLGSSYYKGKQNAMIDSISLTRVYNALKQDSLTKVLQKADPKHYPTYAPPVKTEEIKPLHENLRKLFFKK